MVSGCTPFLADAGGSATELELSDDLSADQVAGIYNAALELNASVGRQVFVFKGEHFGRRGHVTINAHKPPSGFDAYTQFYKDRSEIHLGSSTEAYVILHELIHTILGGQKEHSQDPADIFFARVNSHQVLTDATLERIDARMALSY